MLCGFKIPLSSLQRTNIPLARPYLSPISVYLVDTSYRYTIVLPQFYTFHSILFPGIIFIKLATDFFLLSSLFLNDHKAFKTYARYLIKYTGFLEVFKQVSFTVALDK